MHGGIAEMIVGYREHMNLSPEELAMRARISLSKLQQIERGEHIPNNATLLKLSTVLDIPISQLIEKNSYNIH